MAAKHPFAKALAPLAAALMLAMPASASDRPAEAASGPATVVKADASIPFANRGGVDDWHPVGDDEIWFKDRRDNWYRATLMAPAFDLRWRLDVAIVPGPVGRLDRWGAVVVKGQTYRFASFDQMSGPPPELAKKARTAGGH